MISMTKYRSDPVMTHSPAPEEAIRECPFCGNKPHAEADHWHSTAWEISCDSCDINGISARVWAESKAAAIAAWNRRAGGEREQQLKDVLDRLCGEVSACWGMSEQALRQELGNTNYAIVAAILREARAALAGQTKGERNGG